MRNYVIQNGKHSKYIRGLLIQELPPISKPVKRYEAEEIDGRNGDIITDLGYGAYDKEMRIGLFGDYNVDDVIAYFDTGKCRVTFSNEPDKYYNAEILSQIDFERLVRFRTATVVYHVQPFKYSTVERAKTFAITTEKSVQVRNNGNTFAQPVMTIKGTGTVNLSLNGMQLFVIDFGDKDEITIDTEGMNAYYKTLETLMNRSVTGNYDNFALRQGVNTISWTGSISEISFAYYSRWI